MKLVRHLGLGMIFLAVLGGCTPAPANSTGRPPFEIIEMQITPALEHWLPAVASCADGLPNFGVYTQVLARNQLELQEADLILRLGQRMDSDPHAAIMGYENLVVFTGDIVPVDTISLVSLQSIFTGEITNWEDVPEVIQDGLVINQEILTLAYPKNHELRVLFMRIFLDEQTIQSFPQIFSTINALEIILAENPYAIGFGLQSQLPDNGKLLEITDENVLPIQQYVLAITAQEPEGNLEQLLLCLQSNN